MKVAICVPSGDDVKADFWISSHELLIGMLALQVEPMLLNVRTSLIQNSRFSVVKDALARDADKVLFIDSDMTFSGDAFGRLLSHDKPITGATYVRRREPCTVLGYGYDDVPPGATGLQSMARMPLGFMLIDAEVFRKVPKPWFAPRFQPETDDFVSEDYAFCDAAIAAGYEVWCDLDLSHELGHIGQRINWWGRECEKSS